MPLKLRASEEWLSLAVLFGHRSCARCEMSGRERHDNGLLDTCGGHRQLLQSMVQPQPTQGGTLWARAEYSLWQDWSLRWCR